VLQTQIEFTTSIDEYEKFEKAKINYSNSNLNSGLYFQSTSILFETEIQEQEISVFDFEGNKCFFNVGNESEFNFDPFAASFYLISRYEEYLPHKRDNHGRFLASESLAFQNNFLDVPIVNIWINKIAKRLETHFDGFHFPKNSFKYISTIDIDNAYAYKHKGFIRTLGGLGKSLINGNDFNERLKVLFGKTPDPFDTFNYQFEIHKQYNISPTYFFLLGDYGVNDKNIPVNNKAFQLLIKTISKHSEIGIHPSYSSNDNINIVEKEINRLNKITNQNILKSRQHFLKLKLPTTYNNLIENGITSEYTMGYAEENGFRASICSPFYFYNLNKEKETSLQIFPFTVMEACYQYYKKLTPNEVILNIKELMQKVKDVNGTFISVWHNESLSEKGAWVGWKIVYEKMLKESNT